MLYALVALIALYIGYKICIGCLFPKLASRNLDKYREDFLKKNPHIDPEKLPSMDKKNRK